MLVLEFGRIVLLELFSFLLRMGNYAVRMVGWRVDGIHRKAFRRGGIDDIVDSSRGNDHHIAILHRHLIIFGDYLSFTSFKSEELIYIAVNFLSNVFFRLKGHQNQLQFSGIKDAPEVSVFNSVFFDIRVIWFHRSPLSCF